MVGVTKMKQIDSCLVEENKSRVQTIKGICRAVCHCVCRDWMSLKNGTRESPATAAPLPLLPVEVVLAAGLWETLPRHQVHHRSLPAGQPQRRQCHVAVEEPPLVYKSKDLSFGHRFILPLVWPVVEDILCNVPSASTGTEEELL